ncbi:MAG TPA: antibiotic biosynthesis monooxygenase [Desulfobacteraceae bacterium]|jgi:heme-degrading monooxygenase HmoA|nr:antibiotic biosynthesis monooxygenase [Desulfobacteraceae bacterium]HPJ68440.1 antibiotic biosynthesis monooxygenase [Desulfobacteraceae bacterium]HPQ28712.1 antibiotic biosynthesis monooxygenase [Desulfobacteraceae bacterium]
MSVKILIKRKIPTEKVNDVVVLMMRLRALASKEPGFITGETLRSLSDPQNYLVISTWETIEDWNAWLASEDKKIVQEKIDKILGTETGYEAFNYPEKRRINWPKLSEGLLMMEEEE